MKKLAYFFFLLFITCFFSCSTEEEQQSDAVSTTPCDFNLSNVDQGETITINCLLDLEGESITLPNNVTLVFDNGEIKNGTLNFTDNGKIDGRLLNSSIAIEGKVNLISPIFKFSPNKWKNIVEGETTFDAALKNTTEFEKLMFFIKDLGGDTFEVDNFDAFFEVTTVTSTTSDQNFRPSEEAVNLPSNFHLKMTDQTFLRMFTSAPDKTDGFILAVRDVDNVTITGGNLMGDVLNRGFNTNNPGGTGSLLFGIHSGRQIRFEGVHLENGSAGGLTIFSLGFPFNPDYNPSTGIEIINCTFKNIRRMAISLTDGRDVTIKGNTFENIGQPNSNIDGGEVGYAINLEPYKEQDPDGTVREFQKVFDVLIDSNMERNSRIGFLTMSSSKNVTVQDNTIGTRVGYSFCSNLAIKNNTFIASTTSPQQFAIFCAGGLSQFNFDNKVYGNMISNYGTGIALQTHKVAVYNNTVNNTETGIQLTNTKEVKIYNNTLNVNNIGLLANLTAIDDIDIYENTVNAEGFHIKFSKLNENLEEKDFKVTVRENEFLKQKSFSLFFANGVDILSNTINGGVNIVDSSHANVTGNTIKPNESHGIGLSGDNTDILLKDNIISEPTGASRFQCIDNTSTVPTNISLSNNSCN